MCPECVANVSRVYSFYVLAVTATSAVHNNQPQNAEDTQRIAKDVLQISELQCVVQHPLREAQGPAMTLRKKKLRSRGHELPEFLFIIPNYKSVIRLKLLQKFCLLTRRKVRISFCQLPLTIVIEFLFICIVLIFIIFNFPLQDFIIGEIKG